MRMLILAWLVVSASIASAQDYDTNRFVLPWWSPDARAAYAAYEDELLAIPTPDSLRRWHDLLASEPHMAGSPGDLRVVTSMREAFETMLLDTERQALLVLLSKPVSASVDILSPITESLPVTEAQLDEDIYSSIVRTDPQAALGFNAYAASGTAQGQVVYANHATKEDFARLAELGIDLTGKIVIARYGGNFRGYKAKFAEQAGAAALLIYTDPGDSGYRKGIEFPEGGWAGPLHIQRGSILTLDYPGDPLTPGVVAGSSSKRLRIEDLPLPKIPVQPIGYGAAQRIMQQMTGDRVADDSWQGGLPLAYRITGGENLIVRVTVEQRLAVERTHNVIAILPGSEFPEQLVIIGAHHDSWVYGASDPTSGTICVLEAARALSEMAERGFRPKRSIVFAAWGAEEFGIIGSTEYVESREDMLREHAVAYLNLDMASMGPDFGASASPALKQVIAQVARAVPQARDPQRSVYDAWIERGRDGRFPDEPAIGDLGGGSDHVGFWCHLAIPSAGLSAHGADGNSYHGLYDDLAWYRKVVGDDYEPALMVTRMAMLTAARLANADVLPLDPVRAHPEFRGHLQAISDRGREAGVFETSVPGVDLAPELATLDGMSIAAEGSVAGAFDRVMTAVGKGDLTKDQLVDVNQWLMDSQRVWLTDEREATMARPWFANLFAATDETSGYAAWMLPHLRYCIEHPEAMTAPPPTEPQDASTHFGHNVAAYMRVLRATRAIADLMERSLRSDE